MAGQRRAFRYGFDVVTHLVGREFRLRYRQALFGWIWAVATPVLRLVILAFVFTVIFRVGDQIENYEVLLFTAIIAWGWFSGGVSSATVSAVDSRDLIFRPGLPRAVVPVVSVLADGLDYLAALPVLAAFLLFADGIPWTAVALPAVMAVQLLLTLGLGFALCAANVYLRDVRLVVDVVLLLGFYVTPVFYLPEMVPERYRLVLDLNPMAHILEAHRGVLVYGRLPEAGPFLGLTLGCAAVFAAGYAVYRWASPAFADEL